MRLTVVVFLTIPWAIPRAVTAQTQLEIAPYIGLYQPTTILGLEDADGGPADDAVRHRGSVTAGIRVTTWWPGRLGFEASVGYAPSALRYSYSGGGGLPPSTAVFPAHVWTMSAKLLLRVPVAWVSGGLHVDAGLGAVDHESAFDGAYPPSDYNGPKRFLGAIWNLGGVIKHLGPVGFRLDAEDFMYVARLGPCTRSGAGSASVCDVFDNLASRTTGPRLQNDIVLSLGLALAVNP